MGAQSAGFSSHGFHQSGGTYYETHTYSSGSQSGQTGSDPSIIDLDDQDFSEVSDHDAIESNRSGSNNAQSPWEKS